MVDGTNKSGDEMEDKSEDRDNNDQSTHESTKKRRNKLRELGNCDKVIVGHVVEDDDEVIRSSDNVEQQVLETELRKLKSVLGLLPSHTYSLTRIYAQLPRYVKHVVRSGLTHQGMQKFSPLSRGLQVGIS